MSSSKREILGYPSIEVTPRQVFWKSDARQIPLPDNSTDLVFTSPPYWKKRDYDHELQIGQEPSPADYVSSLMDCVDEWSRVLRPAGSIFLNIGDTYRNKSLVGIPWRVANAMRERGWKVRTEIMWHKPNGMPSPANDRLNSRHEYVFHFGKNEYYFDKFGFEKLYDNPSDVWEIHHDNNDRHLAPFPAELAERVLVAACPPAVCRDCGTPRKRIVEKSLTKLNPERPQARRAMTKFKESDLTRQHLKAIRATGIADAGKGRVVQNGTGDNTEEVVELAKEAKDVLGGYFREFTFPIKVTSGWSDCECGQNNSIPGTVLDPFVGTGTTIKIAKNLGFNGIGVDIDPPERSDDNEEIDVIR